MEMQRLFVVEDGERFGRKREAGNRVGVEGGAHKGSDNDTGADDGERARFTLSPTKTSWDRSAEACAGVSGERTDGGAELVMPPRGGHAAIALAEESHKLLAS